MTFTKPGRFVDRIFVHCSASDNPAHDNAKTIKRWHTDPKPRGRGWSDIGYHFFIRKDGTLENGRPLSITPAAQGGHNMGSIAICLHGLDKNKFTNSQFKTLKEICIAINNAYSGAVTFHGHREVAAKACPVFDYKKVLALDAYGRLGLTGATAKPVDKTNTDSRDPDIYPTIRRGAKGAAVALLQKFLLIKDDGIFGPRTEAAVKDFQAEKGLTRDGIVGPKTWAMLFKNDRIHHAGDL